MTARVARRLPRRLVPTATALVAVAAVLVAVSVAPAGGPRTVSTAAGALRPAVSPFTTGRRPTASAGGSATHDRSANQAGSNAGPAPASVPTGFADQVDRLYGSLVTTTASLDLRDPASLGGSTGQLPSSASFTKDVAGLTPTELAVLYSAVRRVPQWPAAVSDVQRMALSAAPAAPVGSAPTTSATSGAITSGSTGGSVSNSSAAPGMPIAHASGVISVLSSGIFPPPEPSGSFPAPPAAYQPTSPVQNYIPTVCPVGAPGGPSVAPGDSAIFAAQLTNDVAANVAQDVPSTITVIIAGEGTSIPDPALYIAEAIQLAAVVTLDTFNYVQAVANDCDTANRDGFLANIDNTTVNVYDLLTLVQGTLGNVENSVNTISQRLGVLQQTMDTQLTLFIEQALSAPMTSVPNLAFELPASVGGNLDSTPIGVQQVVHAAVQARLAANAPVNPATQRFLALGDAALSSGNDKGAYADYHQAYLQAVGP
jgi:hypothetical protein